MGTGFEVMTQEKSGPSNHDTRKSKMAENIRILIDTREQEPLSFALPAERGTLPTGDYSIKGLENYIAVERKSPDDLVGCLKNGGRDRFEKELSRGRGLDYFALVIESPLADLTAGRYRSEMNPRSVFQSLMAFSIRYRLPVFFTSGRGEAAQVIESLLLKYANEVEKKSKILRG